MHQTRIVLVAGERRHKIADPLAACGLSHRYIPTEGLSLYGKLKSVGLILRYSFRKDTVFIADFAGFFALVTLACAKMRGLPFLLRLRGNTLRLLPQWNSGVKLWLRSRTTRFLFHNADLILPVTPDLKEDLVINHGIVGEKIIPIPVAVNHTVLDHDVINLPSGIQELLEKLNGSTLLLTTSNLHFKGKFEGVQEWIPIVQRLRERHPELEWLIAGQGQFLPQLQEQLQQHPDLCAHTHLLGYVHPVGPLLQRATLFLYFSYEDAMPNVVLEAQLTGTPVIVNGYLPVARLVEDGRTGYIVDPSQIDRTVERIDMLLRDKALQRSIGKNASHTVADRYSELRVGQAIAAAIQQVRSS